MTVLVIGAAVFIGFHLITRLLECGQSVVGLDDINPSSESDLKLERLEQFQTTAACTRTPFDVIDPDIENRAVVESCYWLQGRCTISRA